MKEKVAEGLGAGLGCGLYLLFTAFGLLCSALPIVLGIWIYNKVFN